jgi:hypothetical protein
VEAKEKTENKEVMKKFSIPFSILAVFANFSLCSCGARFYRQPSSSPVPLSSPASARVQISSIQPSSGVFTGGTTLTINGENFTLGIQVFLGSAACLNPVVLSSTALTCTTPPEAVGHVDVSAGTSILPNAYAFVSAVSPTSGFAFASGGTYVGSGTGMSMQATVRQLGRPLSQTGSGVLNLVGMQATGYSP